MPKATNQIAPRNVTTGDQNTGPTSMTSTPALERLGTPQVQQVAETESLVNAAAIYLYRQARFQPISYLDPESLSYQLSEWNVGTMRRFSLTMDAIENRDAVTKSVTSKLKQSLARRSFEIVKVDGADPVKAEAHTKVLKDFYSNLECTNAVDRNIRGGFSSLVLQMMDAALKRYAVHEIVWKPVGDEQQRLTATFIFVPLWFFENRTGSLRFCGNFAWDGIPLKEGNWMVTCGDGIMEAISVAWMYKTISLRDWLIYSEKHGMPGIVGKTPYGPNSPGWKAIKAAVEAVSSDFSAVIGAQDSIEAVQFGQQGQLPYPPLVEYMDKAISALARGADLSTMSAANTSQGQGASLQGDEGDLIEQHYGQMITETLNHYVDDHIIRWHFGEGEEPCAYVKLNVPKRKDANIEMAIDSALQGMGILQSKSSICERYGRTEATEEQIAAGDVVGAAAQQVGMTGINGVSPERKAWLAGERAKNQGMAGGQALGEERAAWLREFRQRNLASGTEPTGTEPTGTDRGQWLAEFRQSRAQMGQALNSLMHKATEDLQPFVHRVQKILEMPNDAHYLAAIKGLRNELPRIASNAQRTLDNAEGLLCLHEVCHHPFHDLEPEEVPATVTSK